MSVHVIPIIKNRLLSALSPEDQALLIPNMDRIQLTLRQMLEKAHQPIEIVYFLESGLGSVVAKRQGGSTIEVGLFGVDGMTGVSLSQGDTESPFDCFTQMNGSAMCIAAGDFVEAMAVSETLKNLMVQYARTLGIQTSYTALANGQNTIEGRLARWILMVHDRVEGDRFSVTHEFLSIMLGVHRPGVTLALQLLESRHCIRSQRGEILIRDRGALITLTKGTYGPSEDEYERLTGISLRKSKPLPGGDKPSLQPA
ncbi:MAG: Crp/Fnr family transcriptional regulator [Allorhizobium sp.]